MHASAGRSGQAWTKGYSGLASHFCLCLLFFVRWHGKTLMRLPGGCRNSCQIKRRPSLPPGEPQRTRSPPPSLSPCHGPIWYPRQRKTRGNQGTTGGKSDVRKGRLDSGIGRHSSLGGGGGKWLHPPGRAGRQLMDRLQGQGCCTLPRY